MHKWIVNSRQRCDLELLLAKAFHPLHHFQTQKDYESVLSQMRLADNALFPMPITLDVDKHFAAQVISGEIIELRDVDNALLAYLTITDCYKPDKKAEALAIFGTLDKTHPGVQYLLEQAGEYYLGGTLKAVALPYHPDYQALRLTPDATKSMFKQKGWQTIIAFQTRNPMHRAHIELVKRAADTIHGHCLIHPVVGMTKPNDVDHYTRVRCYQKALRYFPSGQVMLSLLPLAMRMGGPKEALWHALIRKNYGCTHFIVGRDHAGPGLNAQGQPFYDPFEAQSLVAQHTQELNIEMIPFEELVYCQDRDIYCTRSELKPDERALSISGTQLRKALVNNDTIPSWFSYPDIIHELRKRYPAKSALGLTLFFTGLSSSGKSTLAQAVLQKLLSLGKTNVTILDGDIIRRILSSGLGFSRADRDLNIKRIGFVAAEIVKVGGIALCAAIAPFANAREENRKLISQVGGYIEVYLSASLKTCESRDRKGVYAQSRSGKLQGVTGVDDPYEAPTKAEIEIDSGQLDLDASVDKVMRYLYDEGYLEENHDEESQSAHAFELKAV